MRSLLVLTVVLVPGAAIAQNAPQTAACERLASLSLPNTAITLAQVVNAGAFAVPANPAATRWRRLVCAGGDSRSCAGRAWESDGQHGGSGPWLQRRPRHPAVQRASSLLPRCGDVEAVASSDIHMEMWMPITGWNGHFRGTSPNGLGGVINYNAMGVGLTDGFAVASTDTGHQGGDTAWMQVPDKVTDFAGRAMHETTVAGKALTRRLLRHRSQVLVHDRVRRRLGRGPARGSEVPADYNGVVVGGHAAHLTRQIFGQLWLWPATHPNGVADSAGGEAARHSRCRPGQVRPARRGEGRTARESDPLHVRPEGDRVQSPVTDRTA